MKLQLVGWAREINSGELKRWILYSVSGLPENQNCIIGDAGLGDNGKRKWYAHLYGSSRITDKIGPHDSPEDTLKAVEKLFES